WTASLAYQGDPSRMLFVPPISDLDGQCGLWSRAELLEMDARFCEALERAFEAKLESRAAAAATVRLGPRLDGSRLLKEQVALGAAWNWFREAKFEATAVEVVARVRASCASVTAEQVRAEFKKRLYGSEPALWYARAVDQMAPVTASLDAALVALGVREPLESFLALVGCQGRLASAAPCFRT